MRVIGSEEILAVEGARSQVLEAVASWAIGKVLDAGLNWVKENSAGGADETTWQNVGNSQMGA